MRADGSAVATRQGAACQMTWLADRDTRSLPFTADRTRRTAQAQEHHMHPSLTIAVAQAHQQDLHRFAARTRLATAMPKHGLLARLPPAGPPRRQRKVADNKHK